MLTLDYQDPEDFGRQISFTHDLRTTSRQNRDLIALSIKSFAIRKFYKELNSDVTECINYSEADNTSLSKKQMDKLASERDQVLLTLLETDAMKRMLYQQISLNKALNQEKQSIESRHAEFDEQINLTLHGYKTVLEDTEKKSSDAMMKQEIKTQIELKEKLEEDIADANEENFVLEDKISMMRDKIKEKEKNIIDSKEVINKMKDSLGVPTKKYDHEMTLIAKLKKEIEEAENRIEETITKIAQNKSNNEAARTVRKQLEKEKEELSAHTKKQTDKNEAIQKKIDETTGELEVVQSQLSGVTAIEGENDELVQENEALIAQRNALMKQKETLSRDRDKKLAEHQRVKRQMEEIMTKLTNENSEMMIERSQLILDLDTLESDNQQALDSIDDKLDEMDKEKDALEEKLKSSRSTISQALGSLFKKSAASKTATVGCQAGEEIKEEEDEDEDEMDVDETASVGGMARTPSTVEIDIFKYGSRIKQSVNSSFMSEAPTGSERKKKKSSTVNMMQKQELSKLQGEYEKHINQKNTLDVEKRQADKTVSQLRSMMDE